MATTAIGSVFQVLLDCAAGAAHRGAGAWLRQEEQVDGFRRTNAILHSWHACNGYLAHPFENLRLHLPSLSSDHMEPSRASNSLHQSGQTRASCRTCSGKLCGNCAPGLPKIPSHTVTVSGCASSNSGMASPF